ncbi:hypothetical protein M8818_006852 [Zalaria obscura]|uniref:Uncharacterized protein n=1 Tax=Zalaria obscura TaxID=2024903 RepID=A0ACC3S9H3_9PEZI
MTYQAGSASPYSQPAPTPYHYDPSTPPPPPPKPSASSSGRGTPLRGPPLPPPPGQDSQGFYQTHNGHHGGAALEVPPPMTIPGPQQGWLPSILQDKSTQDLQELLEDHELQTALLNDPKTTHPSLPASQEPLKQLLQSNISLATDLQQLEQRLTQQRSATQSRLLSLRALEQQHRTKIAETEDELRGFSPMALYQRLSASVQEQESLVKGIEESFLEEGGIANEREVADFIRRVREAKRVAFLRAERKERWDEGRVGGWR